MSVYGKNLVSISFIVIVLGISIVWTPALAADPALYDSRIKWGMNPTQVKEFLTNVIVEDQGKEEIRKLWQQKISELPSPDHNILTFSFLDGEPCIRSYSFYNQRGLFLVQLIFEFHGIDPYHLGMLERYLRSLPYQEWRFALTKVLKNYGFDLPNNVGDVYLKARWDELKARVIRNLPPLNFRPMQFYEDFFSNLKRKLRKTYGNPLVTREPNQSGLSIWVSSDDYVILGYKKELGRIMVQHQSVRLSPFARKMYNRLREEGLVK